MAKAKNVSKKKDKVIADKTFGLKNKKKSKKVQEFVKQVEKTVKYSGGKNARIMQKEIDERVSLSSASPRQRLLVGWSTFFSECLLFRAARNLIALLPPHP